MKKHLLLLFFIICSLPTKAQTPAQFTGFEVTPQTGIYFKIIKNQQDSAKAFGFDRAMDFHFVVKNYKDSVLQNTYDTQPIQNFIYQPPRFKGDISEVLHYAAEGDSIIIAVSTDTIRKTAPSTIPSFFPKGTYIKYFLKILKVKSAAEAQAAITKEKSSKAEQARIRRQDSVIIQQYIHSKGLADKVKSTASGLHYVILKEGTGKPPKKDDQVYIDYIMWLGDGTFVDTNIKTVGEKHTGYVNYNKYDPFIANIGFTQLLKGWEESIQLMRQGSKILLLMPSALGYGKRGSGTRVPPNSVLVFELEITTIKKGD